MRALKVLGLLAFASGCTEQEPGSALVVAAAQPRARVELPSHANGAVRVADLRSGVAIAFRLLESRASPRQLRGRSAVYERAWRGATLALHARDDGVEDVLSFAEQPAAARVRYAVELVSVAGLRLVAQSLEFVDATGTPRLRVAPPYVVDAENAVHEAELRVHGCRVDESSLPPWQRSPTPPGATSCELEVDFSKSSIVYPARLDPSWSTTDSLAVARKWAEIARLSDGRVLVAGGDAPSPTRSAELFDPRTETWATVGDMLAARRFFTLVPLASATALAVGGTDGTSVLSTAEVFEAGSWTNTAGAMSVSRQLHAAAPLAADRVLVAGGMDATTTFSTAEIYDAGSRTFTGAMAMNATRRQHTLTPLPNGKLLTSGGTSGTTYRGGEVYDSSANQWTNTLAMSVPRQDHEAALLGDGRVLVVGGFNGALLSAAELYVPAQNAWIATGAANRTHDVTIAVTLDNGAVLVAGGCATGACASGTANTELFDPATGQWREIVAMSDARVTHVAAKLTDGRALIATGLGGGLLSSAELFSLNSAGDPCAVDVECASGSCSAGVCDPSTAAAGGAAGATGASGAAGAVGVGGSGGGATTDGGSGSGGSGGGGSGGTSGAGASAASGGALVAGAPGEGGGAKPTQANDELESFYGCTLNARGSAPGAAVWLGALLFVSLRTIRGRARGPAGRRPGFAKTG
jgi:hypothetical protein